MFFRQTEDYTYSLLYNSLKNLRELHKRYVHFTAWDLHWKCLRFQLCFFTLFLLLPLCRHIVSNILFWIWGTRITVLLLYLYKPLTIVKWHQAYTFWSVFESFFIFIRVWNFIKDKLQFMEYAESANTYFSYDIRLL